MDQTCHSPYLTLFLFHVHDCSRVRGLSPSVRGLLLTLWTLHYINVYTVVLQLQYVEVMKAPVVKK